jgi:hypothetical protein
MQFKTNIFLEDHPGHTNDAERLWDVHLSRGTSAKMIIIIELRRHRVLAQPAHLSGVLAQLCQK